MRDSAPIDGRAMRISSVLLSVVLVLAACRGRKASSSGNSTPGAGDTAVRTIAIGPSAAHAATPPARSAPAAKLAPAVAANKSTVPGPPAVARADSIVTASTSTAPVTNTTSTAVPAAAAPPAPSRLAVALARLPFGQNERLEYQVKYGFLGVGSATLEGQGLDSVRGMPAIHATLQVAGGVRFYRVNDDYESWFDPESYSTLRAVQSIDEGSYDRQRTFEFFPDRKVFIENGKPEAPP